MSETRSHLQRRRQRRGADLLRILIAALVLALTALPVRPDSVGRAETGAFDLFNALPDWLFPPVWVVMQLGAVAAVPAVAAVAFVAGRRRLALDITVTGFGAWGLAKIIKEVFARPRPGGILEMVVIRGQEATGLGYVSGHTAVAFAMAAAAAPYLPRLPRRILWAVALVVGLARIYVGAHLPLDVVGGAALGWGTAALLHLAVGAPTGRPSLEQVRGALRGAGWDVTELVPLGVAASVSAPFRATLPDGRDVFVKVVSEDVGDRDVLARAWRWVARAGRRAHHRAGLPPSQVRHEAAASLLAERAGVRTPSCLGVIELDGSTGILVFDHLDAEPLERLEPDMLGEVMTQVEKLHTAGITHGHLTPADVLVDPSGRPWLVDFDAAQLDASEGDRRAERDAVASWLERTQDGEPAGQGARRPG